MENFFSLIGCNVLTESIIGLEEQNRVKLIILWRKTRERGIPKILWTEATDITDEAGEIGDITRLWELLKNGIGT